MRLMLSILLTAGALALAGAGAAVAAEDKAWTLCQGDDDDASLTACTQIIARGAKEKPKDRAIAFYNRGVSYRNKGDDEKALADYEAALKLNPAYANALNARANVLADRDQLDDAMAGYNAALKLDPDNASYLRNRSLTLVKQNALTAALADLDHAIRVKGTDPQLFYSRGQVYEKQGLKASAVADYRKALGLKADFTSAQEAISRLASGAAPAPSAATGSDGPDTDWDACAGDDDAKSIAGCTAVLARGDREPVETQASAHYNRGVSYRNKGDDTRALADYNEALRLNPSYASALNGRANLRVDQGDVTGALADYAEAIRLDPKDASFFRNRGLTYVQIGKTDLAIADYGRGIAIDPKNHLLFYNRGEAYEKTGDRAKAQADYEAALALKADFADATEALQRVSSGGKAVAQAETATDGASRDAGADATDGDARTDGENTTKADSAAPGKGTAEATAAPDDQDWTDCSSTDADLSLQGCTRVLSRGDKETAENRALAYRNRAVSKYNRQAYRDAVGDLNEALKLDPSSAAGWETRGDAYSNLRQCDKAKPDYDKAIELDAKSAAAFLGRSSCRLADKDYDGAIADANAALTIEPQNAGAQIALANVYTQRNEFERATKALDAAIAVQSERADLRVHRGNVALFAGHLDEAFADYDKATQMDPKSVDAFNGRGIVANFRGQQETAIADFGRAIALDPNISMFYTNRAEVLLDLGRAPEAKPDLDKAIDTADRILKTTGKADPIGFATLLDRAYAKVLAGDLDGGIADANDALATDPRSKEALDTRGLAFAGKRDFPRSIADLTQGIALGGYITPIYRHRAETYEAAGNYDLAIDDYEAVLRLAPGHAIAKAGLVRVKQALADTKVTPVTPPPTVAQAQPLGRRVALVIGNSDYQKFGHLPNPQRDAARLAQTLREVGFSDVKVAENLTVQGFNEALRSFAQEADGADWAMIYYAGHGIEISNNNFLIPVDAQLASDRDVDFEAVPLDKVIKTLDGASGMRLVILDACRENPFAAAMKRTTTTRAITRGLARIEPDSATLVAYAAKAGQVAQDGDGENSPFVTALTNRIRTPGIEIGKLFRLVRNDVLVATRKQQEPVTYGALPTEDMYINPPR